MLLYGKNDSFFCFTFGENALTIRKQMVPFLKWAGGKRWLVQQMPEIAALATSSNRYFEPFLGGAAVFLSIKPKNAVLADTNSELIKTYRGIARSPLKTRKELGIMQSLHSTEFYYDVRAGKFDDKFSQAAIFIYLNRTCFNGLYRVNREGQFNVPIGTKKSVILPTDQFSELAKLLKSVTLRSQDFEKTIQEAGRNDFIFVDPPYVTGHQNNGFIKYNESIFSWDDQIRLADCVRKAISRGAKVVVTNAWHKALINLYRDMGDIMEVSRPSLMSGANKGRGKISEMVLINKN